MSNKTVLGIEFGSTRIKAVTTDLTFKPLSLGDYTWKSTYVDGVWTYDLDQAFEGLRTALSAVEDRDAICAMGISGMMHGYLAFDENWKLLTPFRTWQNTITAQAAKELTELFGFNIPQRWSVAHLYQAILNGEAHVKDIAHITTLAGYVHFRLTGVNALGIGEASGMFPIDSSALDYDAEMLRKFDALLKASPIQHTMRQLLPAILLAGQPAGELTPEGAQLTGGLLRVGIPFAPPEGDAGTGMVATNAVAPRTGNVSAGTSIFSMVVLEKPLSNVYEEIDMVTTPSGSPVAMVHCNNCLIDANAWTSMLRQTLQLFDAEPDTNELYNRLYNISLDGDPDCGGLVVFNYVAGEGVTHMDNGVPMLLRAPDAKFTLANFMRAQLYTTMATLKIGMDLLAREHVAIDSLTGHGGLFKTPKVGQSYLAAACDAPVTCMQTAGEGGPYGMALLAAYMAFKAPDETLESFLSSRVFKDVQGVTLKPAQQDVQGFNDYLARFKALLDVERAAAAVKL